MKLKIITERKTVNLVQDILAYYSSLNDSSINKIITKKDEEATRNNVGWYQHIGKEHRIFLNAVNIMCASTLVDYETYLAFVSLCTGHEFRHFLQGTVIYDDEDLADFNKTDAFSSDLMLFIRYFFDAYYILNKGSIKYELDAEKFAIINGLKYLQENYPKINAAEAMLKAINFYAGVQLKSGVSTLPYGCKSISDAISKLDETISENARIETLNDTLDICNSKFYFNHLKYGLDLEKLCTRDLLIAYMSENDGLKRDLMVARRILASLDSPLESLEQFPRVREKYLEKSL